MDYPVNNHYTKITAKSRRRHERPLWPVGAVARGGEGGAPLLCDQLVHREVEERLEESHLEGGKRTAVSIEKV